jgi:hypothetical protein
LFSKYDEYNKYMNIVIFTAFGSKSVIPYLQKFSGNSITAQAVDQTENSHGTEFFDLSP